MRRAIAALLLCAAGTAGAEQMRRVDGYEIHYNAFRADFLPVAVAKRHGLTRAADRGLLIVTVLRPRSDATLEAIEADVVASVSRAGETSSAVRMRAVREPGSVSYMGSFAVDGDRPYSFALEVRPFGADAGHRIRFRQAVAAQ